MLLTEYYDKADAYKSVWIGFIALAVFMIMGQFTIRLAGEPETRVVNEAMAILFDQALRISIASAAAYLLSQHLNIFIFDYLRRKTAGKLLWLRIMAGAGTGQLLDSAVFFSVAFAGEVSPQILIEIILVGFVIKVLVAALSIPFIKRGRVVRPEAEKYNLGYVFR